MKIAYMNGVADYVVGEVVGLSNYVSAFDTTTCHPKTEAARMMIPAMVGRGELSLRIYSPAEFPAPNDQGAVQQPA